MPLTVGDIKIILADYVIDVRLKEIEIAQLKAIITGLEAKLAETPVPADKVDASVLQ